MNCKNCDEFFDSNDKLPYTFNCCGETICKNCCEKEIL